MKTYEKLMEDIYSLLEIDLNRKKFVASMEKEQWTKRKANGGHDIYTHPNYPGHAAVPRTTELSRGVHRQLSKAREVASRSSNG